MPCLSRAHGWSGRQIGQALAANDKAKVQMNTLIDSFMIEGFIGFDLAQWITGIRGPFVCSAGPI